MKRYEILDTTADIGIRAFGAGLPEVYVNVALGMLSLITNVDTVEERLERNISVTAPDRDSLLVEWINELIFLFDTEMILFSRFEIIKLSELSIETRCFGEKVDKSRHDLKRGIKSATYHKLKLKELKDRSFQAEVLLDI
jgi:SHS2 domain-containing protein